MTIRSRAWISLLIALTLILAACGGGAPAAEAPAEEAAPLAQEEAPAEEAAEEEAAAEEEEAAEEVAEEATEEPAEEAAEEEGAAEEEATEEPAEEAAEEEAEEEAADEAAADDVVVATVSEYLATIPEGFMSVGNVESFKEVLDATDVYLIDVREVGEYEGGHIGDAINIPIRELAQNLESIPTDQPVIVYCASGHRAGLATTALRVLGYDNVRAFPAGWRGWDGAGEEASTEPGEAGSFEVPEFDPAVFEAVDGFLSNIPEGFLAIGDTDRLQEMMDAGAMTLVDVRELGELEDGIIPGAITIPIRTIPENLDQIPTDQTVVNYCASGFRAALSTAAMQIMGYDNARSFPPSWRGWTDAGLEVEMVE